MRKLLLTLIALMILAMVPAQAQEFYGLTEKRIVDLMAGENPDLIPDSSVRNNIFRYLKYYSEDDSETWLIFLDDRGRCYGVRITCSINKYDEKIRELNAKYGSAGNNVWSYMSGRQKIIVTVKKDASYFTVTHEQRHHM